MSARRPRAVLAVAAAALALSAAVIACEPAGPYEMRLVTDNHQFLISSDPLPPIAREPTLYRVIVRDKETREPIDGGEGRIFATSQDQANTWDVLTPGPELGSYYGRLRYVTSGEWAVAIQFRRDSTRPLERVDWYQEVRAARDEPVTN